MHHDPSFRGTDFEFVKRALGSDAYDRMNAAGFRIYFERRMSRYTAKAFPEWPSTKVIVLLGSVKLSEADEEITVVVRTFTEIIDPLLRSKAPTTASSTWACLAVDGPESRSGVSGRTPDG